MRIYLDGHGPPQQMDRDDEQVLKITRGRFGLSFYR
jgi:hypothetical protein